MLIAEDGKICKDCRTIAGQLPDMARAKAARLSGRLGGIGHGFVLKNVMKRGDAGSDRWRREAPLPSDMLPVDRNKCKKALPTSGLWLNAWARDRLETGPADHPCK